MVDGTWVTDPSTVKNIVRQFFVNRFVDSEGTIPKLEGVPFKKFSSLDNTLLVASNW